MNILYPAAALLVLAGCGHSARTDLASQSGVDGAGAGPSTAAALAGSPVSSDGGSTGSVQTNTGPNAGGPH